MYFRSKAQRSPGCIHGNVSAAYYRNLLACHDRCIIGIIEAFIRLLLVRYSLAENTPLAVSPGIPINIGRPAPEPINTASKSSSSISWSMVVDFPITTFVSNLTPNSFTFSISFLTTFPLEDGTPEFRILERRQVHEALQIRSLHSPVLPGLRRR